MRRPKAIAYENIARKSAIPHSARELGFTLIEIMIAIMILATSFMVILGLQSAVTKRAVHDRFQQRALLVARAILATLESGNVPAEYQNSEGPALKMLEDFKLGTSLSQEEQNALTDLYAQLVIENWESDALAAVGAVFEPDMLKRVTLTLAWGEGPQDRVAITFFVPNEEETEGAAIGEEEGGDEEE